MSFLRAWSKKKHFINIYFFLHLKLHEKKSISLSPILKTSFSFESTVTQNERLQQKEDPTARSYQKFLNMKLSDIFGFEMHACVDVFVAQRWCYGSRCFMIFSCTHSNVVKQWNTSTQAIRKWEERIRSHRCHSDRQSTNIQKEKIFPLVHAPCFHRFGACLTWCSKTPATTSRVRQTKSHYIAPSLSPPAS